MSLDPTRTTLIRRAFMAELGRRYHTLQERVRRLVVGEDVFGLTRNAREWAAHTEEDKLREFRLWLDGQLKDLFKGEDDDSVFAKYVEQGYRRGAGRAFDDVGRAKGALATLDEEAGLRLLGAKEQFLRTAFGRPVGVERLRALVRRTLTELRGVSDALAGRMMRVLADGFVRGDNPRVIARALVKETGLSATRARTVARTEVVRAHAEGQLDGMEALGVAEVGVSVEWSATNDGKVCPLCAPLDGIVLKLSEARGMLPRHPNCRCAWIPANVGESTRGQRRGPKMIRRAIRASARKGKDDWAKGKRISTRRPARNTFHGPCCAGHTSCAGRDLYARN